MSVVFQTELENMGKFEQNLNWFQANYDDLKQKYGEQYVAINDGELVDYDIDLPYHYNAMHLAPPVRSVKLGHLM